MPPKRSNRKHARADLPVDVWARVAAHMSLQEWAQASGTCRSTRAVRLKHLTIKNIPGVRWASRMLDEAETLCLSPESLQQVALGVARGLQSIKHLQQLVVNAPASYGFSDPALSCLQWLLAQLPQLEVLVALAGGLPWFPPLATLKHLSITFHRDAGNICEAVPGCTALETLSLIGQGRTGSMFLKIGHLDMANLSHLRVCVLKGIAAKKISVSKACRLHVDISAGFKLHLSKRRGILANIHSINVSLPHPDADSIACLLKSSVEPLQNLRVLSIQVYSTHPVLNLKSFAVVDKLRISGRSLALQLPAGVCWDALELNATDKLTLDFEDLSGFPAAVPRFAATYSHLQGSQVLQLCTALALNGIKSAFREEEKQGRSMFWYPAGQRPVGCCCGACLDCLVASGQAVGHGGQVEEATFLPKPPHMYDDVYNEYGGYGSMEEQELFEEELEEERAALAAEAGGGNIWDYM